jgi:hypothetical protein
MPGSNSVDCLTDPAEIFLHFLFEAAISHRLRKIFERRCVVSEQRDRNPAVFIRGRSKPPIENDL